MKKKEIKLKMNVIQEIGRPKRNVSEQSNLTIHDGIFCNNCKMPLIGK